MCACKDTLLIPAADRKPPPRASEGNALLSDSAPPNFCKMHSAHFPAQAVSLNAFCSCGASGGPVQVDLSDHLCLLDKTWHIGFYTPAPHPLRVFKSPLQRCLVLSQPDYSSAVTKLSPTYQQILLPLINGAPPHPLQRINFFCPF